MTPLPQDSVWFQQATPPKELSPAAMGQAPKGVLRFSGASQS